LKQTKDEWRGTLIFVAQPAEEKGQGAQAMLDDGLFARFPRPDYALALHVDSQLATGKIGYQSGYAFANVDSVDLVIYGRGGHGAYPQLAVDPIVIASEIVVALQTVVSRELKPYEAAVHQIPTGFGTPQYSRRSAVSAAVLTVGSIHGGTKHNIIPDEVKLELTLRSYTDEVRNQILEAVKRIATGIARAHRAPRDPDVQVTESIPSTYNDPVLVDRLLPIFQKTFGEAQVIRKDPEMGGEDFGLFARAGVPAFLFRIGSVSPERIVHSRKPEARPLPSLHSSEYTPDPEPTIATGVRAMTAAVLELCATPPLKKNP
jgi:hippurate hydrolase